ncbi:MAG: hypothetical protein H6Q16_1285 [Bacteroidetes bacterium]|nr:hypothetical protein [Bacteroidota bacterium]
MKKLLFLMALMPLQLFAQWSYVGNINDICDPPVTFNYTYTDIYPLPTHGYGYNIYRNGTLIRSESGMMGCCSLQKLEVFTDSIVLIAIGNEGNSTSYITLDAGNTWAPFCVLGGVNIVEIIMINQNTGYALLRDITNNNKLSILRISDINSKILIPNNYIDNLVTDVYLTDTIFGESYCPNIQNIGFKIQQDGVEINYHINVSNVKIGLDNISQDNSVRISPNPVNDKLIIESNDDYFVKIYNNFGQELRLELIKNGYNTIDMSTDKSGIYFFSFYNNDMHVTTKKIIKN